MIKMHGDKELRKVPAAFLEPIADILDDDDAWKKVMSLIPKHLDNHIDHFEPKYNSEHMRLIEKHAQENKLKYANVLFDEWGTSGIKRPTLRTLMDVLIKAHMFRAADSLAKLINENPPQRPMEGPPAYICTDVTSIINSMTSEQVINPSQFNENSNGTNETYEALCNVPTKKIGSPTFAESLKCPTIEYMPHMSAINLMEFPNSEDDIPNFDAMCPHSTAMIPNKNVANVSDLMKFSQEKYASVPTSEYIPRFSELIPQIDVDNSSMINSRGSASNSETSQSASEFISQSDHSLSLHTLSSPVIAFEHDCFDPDINHQVDSEILEDTKLIKFNYAELERITKNFTGTHVGSGGFGDVFVGNHDKFGLLAIKRAHISQSMQLKSSSTDIIKFFNSEVKSLSILRHENIVPIIGFSLDGPAPCIVCKYIERGSLLENIAAKVLNVSQRMNIMIGTAEGLKYIHNTENPMSLVSGSKASSRKAYLLHGDVKSANILINKDYVPMLCDFGLSKQCATTFHTESITGTSAYMAPERFSGTITQKGDIFSYGIVLLELLTGLEPIVTEDNETLNIKMYVEEKCTDDDIRTVVDPKIGNWPKAQNIYNLAMHCMKINKNKRPTIDHICDSLHKINESEQRVFYADV